MGHEVDSEAGLQQNSKADTLGNINVYIPSEERKLERSQSFIFGVCKRCLLPIRYPSIKFPISCQEVHAEGGINTYDVEYCDMHVSCALAHLIDNASNFIGFKTKVQFKRPIWEKLFARFIGSVSSSFNIDTPRRS